MEKLKLILLLLLTWQTLSSCSIEGCETCNVQGTLCQKCLTDFHALIQGQTVCCDLRTHFIDFEQNCSECPPGCEICGIVQIDGEMNFGCESCLDGYHISGAICCEEAVGEFPSVENECQQCSAIIDNCGVCEYDEGSKKVSCKICQEENGYYLSGGACCDSNSESYPKSDGTCDVCGSIINNCQSCEVNQGETTCTSCQDGWESSGDACCDVDSGFYPKSDGTCDVCGSIINNCQSCEVISGVTKCTACRAGWESSGDICCDVELDFYPKSDGTCDVCGSIIDGCSTCQVISGVTKCTACQTDWELSGDLCCDSNADSYPKSDGTCDVCGSIIDGCSTCQVISGVTKCTACQTDWELSGDLCCDSNADSYPKSDGTCDVCGSIIDGCSTCQVISGVTKCTACQTDWELSGDLCCDSNADSYPKSDGTCDVCGSIIDGCSTCQVISGVTKCTACQTDWELSGDLCCDSNADSYPKSDGTCDVCGSIIDGCSTCQVISGVTKCTACQTDWELSGDLCCDSNADSYPKSDGTCDVCGSIIDGCSTCQVISGVTKCTACQTDWELSGDLCCDSNADSYPKSDGTCDVCGSIIDGCSTCQVISGVTKCIACQTDWELSGDLCCDSNADSYPKSDGTCDVCGSIIDGCSTCQVISGVTKCTACQTDWELSGDLCCDSNADSYPKSDGTCDVCGSIIDGCSTCQVISGVTKCTACQTDWELSGDLCCDSNADSYPKSDGTCDVCGSIIDGCSTCQVISGVTKCTACQTDWELSGDLCCDSNADSYPKSDGTCDVCGSIIDGCSTCQVISGVTKCTACQTDWELSGDLCCDSNADSYPKSDGTCDVCGSIIDGCSTCQVISGVTKCTACQTDWELSGDLCCDSNADSYPKSDGTCDVCGSIIDGCSTCQVISGVTKCTACQTDWELSGDLCCDSNADSYPKSDGTCDVCGSIIDGCSTCQVISGVTKCTACQTDWELSGDLCCDSNADSYPKSDGTCDVCGSIIDGCSTCQVISGVTKCTACQTDWELSGDLCCDSNANSYPNHQNGGCSPCSSLISGCPSCSYQDSTLYCQDCSSLINSCSRCTSSITCVDCLPTHYLVSRVCLPCSLSEFASDDGLSCLPCSMIDPSCHRCSDKDTCDECIEGYGVNNDNECTLCSTIDASCKRCADKVCVECYSGHALLDGECSSAPLGGNGMVEKDGIHECPGGCRACSDVTTCTDCATGYFLEGDLCSACSSSCKSCEGSAEACTDCYAGTYLDDSACMPCRGDCLTCIDDQQCLECPDRYFLNQNICGFCHIYGEHCTECTINECSACVLGYTLWERQCKPCLAGCTSCHSDDITTCLTCADGFAKEGGECVKCGENCKICSADSCQVCDYGYVLYDGNCIPACKYPCYTCQVNAPDSCTACFGGYTFDSRKNTCEFDNACSVSKTCESCSRGHFLSEGQCQECQENCNFCSDAATCTKCVSHYYVSGGSCVRCPEECQACSSPSSCQSCASGYYLQSDSAGFSTGLCKPCSTDVFCQECTIVDSLCTSCLDGYQLSNSKCVSVIRVGFSIKLDMELSEFLPKVYNFTDAFITTANISTAETDHPVHYRTIQAGSVNIEGDISAYSESQGENIYEFVDTLEGTTIGGEFVVLSASSERIGFQGPQETLPVYAIVLLVILPLILIAFIVGYVKISKNKASTAGSTDTSKPFTLTNSEQKIKDNF